MSGSNVCIWKIEQTLENIIPLLREINYRNIPQLESYLIPVEEKRYEYKWIEFDGLGLVESVLDINKKELRFLVVKASIEKPSIATDKFIIQSTEQPLPKYMRVTTQTSDVCFVKMDGYVYCIIKGPKSLEGTIRGSLMNYRKKDSSWGNLTYEGLPELSFCRDFYYWILTNNRKKITDKDKLMVLQDVVGFKSNTERSVHSYSGTGPNIDDEIPLKSLVSMDENLESLYMKILYNNVTYSFYLDCDARLSIMFNECGEYATQSPKMFTDFEILLVIYFDIIPFLSQQFNKSKKNNWVEIKKIYKKQKSIEVIQKMMTENDIDVNEINALATE